MQHISQALGELSNDRIPCVILGMAYIIKDSDEDHTSLSEDCVDDCRAYATQIAKSSAPLWSIEYTWIWKLDHRIGHVTPLIFGTNDTKKAWVLLETYGYDPRQIFRAIPPDDRLLPYVRYAHLWLPPEQKEEIVEEVEFDPETYEPPPDPQFTCIKRHLRDGSLIRNEREGFIRYFQTRACPDDDRPMLLVFELNIFDFVQAALSSITPMPQPQTNEREGKSDSDGKRKTHSTEQPGNSRRVKRQFEIAKSAILHHHRYGGDGFRASPAANLNDLVEKYKISKSTFSRVFQKLGGYQTYVSLCDHEADLHQRLKLFAGDLTPEQFIKDIQHLIDSSAAQSPEESE